MWGIRRRRFRRKCASETDADPTKLLWIDPTDVEYLTGTVDSGPTTSHLDHVDSFHRNEVQFGSVRGGDWDQSDDRFTDLKLCQAIDQRIREGNAWESTEFYRRHVQLIEKQGESFSCESEARLRRNCERTDKLIDKIREDGYKTQRELGTGKPSQEICVNIGRDGQFLFNGGGRHRLSIARALELSSVPVLVLVRHRQWQATRDRLRKAENPRNVTLDASLAHPDLEELHSIR